MTEATTIPQPAAIKKATRPAAKPKEDFVTKAEFTQLTDVLTTMAGVLEGIQKKIATPAETKQDVEAARAKHDSAPVPESWEIATKDILGEIVDHVELFQPRSGGTLFTVVIKPEFSNAPKEYLERNKYDRRTKEIGNEGVAGVENWCKLIKANLKRNK